MLGSGIGACTSVVYRHGGGEGQGGGQVPLGEPGGLVTRFLGPLTPSPPPPLCKLSVRQRHSKAAPSLIAQALGKACEPEDLTPPHSPPLRAAPLLPTTLHPRAGCKGNLSTHGLVGGGDASPGRLGFWCQMRGHSPATPKTPLKRLRAVTASGLLEQSRWATITRSKSTKLQFQPEKLQA